jgi:tRNA (cytidine/uridine-2'-O-)-methyltransferase
MNSPLFFGLSSNCEDRDHPIAETATRAGSYTVERKLLCDILPHESKEKPPMRLALYQPDIPQNTGAILRLCACLGVAVELIEPFGFVWDDRHLKRAGMDYLEQVTLTRHRSWEAFQTAPKAGRLILLTTQGTTPYHRFGFRDDDTLLFGRESAGVPDEVHRAADARVTVPMRRGLRSINVAMAAGMVLGEALRQTNLLPEETP